jgi:hypothetical protein
MHNGIGQTLNTLVPFGECIGVILPGRGRWPLVHARKVSGSLAVCANNSHVDEQRHGQMLPVIRACGS